jgi:hypothetical protein
MITATGIVSSGGVTNFFPSVVATLGFNSLDTLLLTAPPYLLAVITVSANAWHADRTGERYLHIVLPLCVSIVSFILAAATTKTGPRYFAMMIMPGMFYLFYACLYSASRLNTWHPNKEYSKIVGRIGKSQRAKHETSTWLTKKIGSFYASFVVTYAWVFIFRSFAPGSVLTHVQVSNSLPRPPAKRAAALAFINAVSNGTSIYVSYLYQTKWKPRYVFAMSFNAGTAVMAILSATALKILLTRLNKRLDNGEHVDGAVIGDGEEANEQGRKAGFRFLT